jgi:hypothetical protein
MLLFESQHWISRYVSWVGLPGLHLPSVRWAVIYIPTDLLFLMTHTGICLGCLGKCNGVFPDKAPVCQRWAEGRRATSEAITSGHCAGLSPLGNLSHLQIEGFN